MSRIPPKFVGVLLSATAVAGLAAGPAGAAQGLVDGEVTAEGVTCGWTDGVTSNTPPGTLTVDRSTINAPGGNLGCSDGGTATLNNDPTVAFDDANGTATADALDVSVSRFGVTCRYRASDMSAQREGDTRTYTATADVPLYRGGSFCADPASVTATFTFR